MEQPGGHRGLRLGTGDRAERVGWAGTNVCTSRALWGWWVRARTGSPATPPALTRSTHAPSCVCKEGEVGDGRACYGHLLHEVQKASQINMMFLRLRVTLDMLGV